MAGCIYFISGIDTGIGKTVVTGLMARWLRARGVDAITVKMVQTGNDGFSEDLDAHRAMCELGRLPEDEKGLTAPQIFRFPSSPLLAARLEGRAVDLAKIAAAVRACAAAREVVLVESAGGLCVPLAEETLSVDFAAAQDWPLLLVTCGRLGSVNHTILSLEAAKARGMAVAGVAYNWFPGVDPQIDADSFETTRRALVRLGFPPAVVRVPRVPAGSPCPDIDFTPIFRPGGAREIPACRRGAYCAILLPSTRKDLIMQTPEEFLEANGLETRTIDRAGLVAAFQKEMEAGLAGEPSSLKMIPTFTSPYGEVTKDSPVMVLDAGGTNFRAGTVTIPSDGSEIKIEHVEKAEMPGAKSYVSQEDFYAVLTGQVKRCEPFVKDNAVGFCFSYPAEASAEGDAKLLHWTKQIQAPEIVGQWVGAEMAKRLDPKPSRITVVNDTVATLLAGKAVEKDVHYSAYLGFILGTGTNVAYIEKNANIGKLKDAPEGYMAINTESGGFNKIAQSKFDEAMDKKSADCGTQRFEKMIAGAYLGRIGLEVFKAAAREGFFSEEAKAAVLQLGALESYDLDNFCAMYDNGKPNPLMKTFVDEKDRATARRLATPVFERAAIFTAIHLAAFIIKTGGGTDPNAPVNVCIDGSTYYKTRAVSFPEIVKRELDAMLAARNISYALTVCPDCAPMVGAAVAALLK